MQWDWSRFIELTGLVVTILSLHMSNVVTARKTREAMLERLTRMETKMNLMYGWFKSHVFKISGGSGREDDSES